MAGLGCRVRLKYSVDQNKDKKKKNNTECNPALIDVSILLQNMQNIACLLTLF